MMRVRRVGALLWLRPVSCPVPPWRLSCPMMKSSIFLRARVDTFKQSVGIVVGIVDSSGTRIVRHGPPA